MSRDLADENYYVSQGRDKIPVKWTAPEAIHYKKYSTASDVWAYGCLLVWAYGCLLYEIWSVGYKPFEGVPNINVSTVFTLVSGTLQGYLAVFHTSDSNEYSTHMCQYLCMCVC